MPVYPEEIVRMCVISCEHHWFVLVSMLWSSYWSIPVSAFQWAGEMGLELGAPLYFGNVWPDDAGRAD